MKNKIKFQIKHFGPIHEVNMDIGKINIIGGHNSTGKSTASKLLYSFLRSSFSKRGDYAYEKIKKNIVEVIHNIYRVYGIRHSEVIDLSKFNKSNIDYLNYFEKSSGYYEKHFDDLTILEKYFQAKQDYSKYDRKGAEKRYIKKEINEIDEILDIIRENSNALFLSIFKTSLIAEFGTNNLEFISSLSGIKNNNQFSFSVNFKDYNIDSDKVFISEGNFEIEDVFYIDSFSFFETSKPWRDVNTHVGYIRKMLNTPIEDNYELFDDVVNKNIISIENKIKKIIGGGITLNQGKFYFSNKNLKPIDIQNTASGIKQIGIIQLLLANRRLKEDCFLIIDEPEVNLHPEWQFKFAEILVLLAKELNITLYINSHSPMFIEAIEVLTQYYDLDEDTNFYLAEKHGKDTYDFIKIEYDDLYELYDNLAKPFDSIEVYRLKNEYKKGNY